MSIRFMQQISLVVHTSRIGWWLFLSCSRSLSIQALSTRQRCIYIGDLIANIGGTLGLFVGVSLLNFVEIIELIINLCFIYCNKLETRKNWAKGTQKNDKDTITQNIILEKN
jgi:hypothetical protein